MTIKPNATYTVAKQTFLNSVVNKIGKQEYADQTYVNPLKRLKSDFIENASDIEEIYVSKADDTGYDVEGKGQFDRVKPVTFTQYHRYEKEHGYKITIQDKEIRKGFLTKGGVSKMADHIIQSMHTGAEIDEYQDVIDTLKAMVNDTDLLPTQTINCLPVVDEVSSKKFCKEVKKIIPKMGEYNSLYSIKPNFAPLKKLILFLDSDVDVEIQTEYLASLFNMTIAQLNDTTKIVIPNLKAKLGNGTFAVLCDERCIKIHPTYYNVESCRNTRGKFTNMDLVTSSLLSYTTWFQMVIFKESATK